MDIIWMIIPAFLIFFALLWTGIVFLSGYLAGMTRDVSDVETGLLLAESGYGSARMGLVNYSYTIKIREYEKGFMLQTMPIFGGFKRWLPHDEIEIGPLVGGFIFSYRVIETPGKKVTVYGRLAEFFE